MRIRTYAAALLVAWGGTVALAQKVTTPEELDKTMKRVQTAMMAANKALKAQDFDEASKQLTVVKGAMEDSREFWVLHKKDDALKANTQTVTKIEETQKILQSRNAEGSMAALKELGGACRTCHETYRVRDADNNWVLKPGSVN